MRYHDYDDYVIDTKECAKQLVPYILFSVCVIVFVCFWRGDGGNFTNWKPLVKIVVHLYVLPLFHHKISDL